MIEKLREVNPGLTVIMHSDGAVAPLIDDFTEIGVDVYNPVQPNVPGSDPRELKDKYGKKICFFGGIDQQELLPSGDTEKIRSEIKNRISILGKDRGYLLAPAHIIQPDVSPETIEIMIAGRKRIRKILNSRDMSRHVPILFQKIINFDFDVMQKSHAAGTDALS